MACDEVSDLPLRLESLGDPLGELDTIEGLFKIRPGAASFCPALTSRFWKRRHENDGQLMAFLPKALLKIEAAYSGELDIRDQAGGPGEIARLQKGLRGGKGESDEAQRRNQAFRRDAAGFIVVNNGYDGVLGQLSHFG